MKEQSKAEEAPKLKIIFSYDERWSNVPNTLLRDGPNWFLGSGEGSVLQTADRVEDIKPASLIGVLEWLVRCDDFSSGNSGSLVPVFEQAAMVLRQGERL